MTPYIVIGALVATVLIMLWLRKKKRADSAWKQDSFPRAVKIVNDTPAFPTPAGHQMFKEAGVTNLNEASNDLGIEETFKKCECAGYVVRRAEHNFKTVIFNSIPDSQGDPAFKLFIAPGNAYYGSEYDKEAGKGQEVDHYVLVAGQMVAVGQPLGDIIIIPEHSPSQAAHQALATEFEAEHVDLAWYDGDKYEQTKYHLTGGHPLIDPCAGIGKISSRYEAVVWPIEGDNLQPIYSCVLLTK